jgi:hypothetical protein
MNLPCNLTGGKFIDGSYYEKFFPIPQGYIAEEAKLPLVFFAPRSIVPGAPSG